MDDAPTCQCGRGPVVGVLTVRLGGAVIVRPAGPRASGDVVDERCADCVADATRFLGKRPSEALEMMGNGR